MCFGIVPTYKMIWWNMYITCFSFLQFEAFHDMTTGIEVGTVVGMVGAGLLCQNGFAGGWPSVFYVFGESWSGCEILLGCQLCQQHVGVSEGRTCFDDYMSYNAIK